MNNMMRLPLVASSIMVAIAITACAPATESGAPNQMTFFVSSVGAGQGADLGGLPGADRHCQALGRAAGASSHSWRAYLSATPSAGGPAINARDRIGGGPWHNSKGILIAQNVDQLHTNNNINKQTALTEKGEPINGRGDEPNRHDILTGSQPDGRAVPGEADTTCGNWTKSGEGSAIVGHHDRMGLDDTAPAKSWNSSHSSKGCSQELLRSTGGDGLLYCFAAR